MFFEAPDHRELNAELDRLAATYDVTPTAIATAWITRHPARMQVALGTPTNYSTPAPSERACCVDLLAMSPVWRDVDAGASDPSAVAERMDRR